MATKIYLVVYDTGVDYESESTSIQAIYWNREDAEEHLARIKDIATEFVQEQGYGAVYDKYSDIGHISASGINGDWDNWNIVEREIEETVDYRKVEETWRA